MDRERLNEIIARFLAGKATEAEKQLLHRWYDSFDSSQVVVPATKPDEKERTEARLLQRIQATLNAPEIQSPRRTRLGGFYRAAASVLLVLGLGVAGVSVWQRTNSGAPPVYAQFYTPAGKQRTLTLPDGTTVHLNADTKLRAPVSFSGDTRRVFLEGEAFFEVARNPDQPFIITTGKLRTQVLGTRFNVRAYAGDAQTEVTVLSGKVSVGDRASSVVLTPSQQASYNQTSGRLTRANVPNAESYRAWTTGQLIFEQKSLGEIIATLNRQYDVRIRLENERMATCVLKAKFDREPLDRVLTVLCSYVGARYKREGNAIVIKGKGC
ncbi:MAG: FecR domain-containing protein [Ferruginibacter sp.]|nr:FecR domain-containing protein [Cytophagales bacterium]